MGIIVSVYRNAEITTDCTRNGISSRFTKLCIVNVPGPFEPTEDAPAAMLVPGNLKGTAVIMPATFGNISKAYAPAPGWHMMGGNYGATSDSRFCEAVRKITQTEFYGAVPIHDRQEPY